MLPQPNLNLNSIFSSLNQRRLPVSPVGGHGLASIFPGAEDQFTKIPALSQRSVQPIPDLSELLALPDQQFDQKLRAFESNPNTLKLSLDLRQLLEHTNKSLACQFFKSSLEDKTETLNALRSHRPELEDCFINLIEDALALAPQPISIKPVKTTPGVAPKRSTDVATELSISPEYLSALFEKGPVAISQEVTRLAQEPTGLAVAKAIQTLHTKSVTADQIAKFFNHSEAKRKEIIANLLPKKPELAMSFDCLNQEVLKRQNAAAPPNKKQRIAETARPAWTLPANPFALPDVFSHDTQVSKTGGTKPIQPINALKIHVPEALAKTGKVPPSIPDTNPFSRTDFDAFNMDFLTSPPSVTNRNDEDALFEKTFNELDQFANEMPTFPEESQGLSSPRSGDFFSDLPDIPDDFLNGFSIANEPALSSNPSSSKASQGVTTDPSSHQRVRTVFNEKSRAQARQLLRQGVPLTAVAEQTGYSVSGLKDLEKRKPVPNLSTGRQWTKTIYTPEEKAKVCDLLNEGWKPNAISKITGINISTIRGWNRPEERLKRGETLHPKYKQ